jgi:hypothetical protein
MPNIELDFLGVSNKERSLIFDARQSINWFASAGMMSSRKKIMLMPTAGLLLAVDLSGNAIRGELEKNNVLYVVKDDAFYTVDTAMSGTNRGSLLTSTGKVTLVSNGIEVIVVDGTYGYIYNIASATFTRITDGDFPANPLYVTYQDGYFLVVFVDRIMASDLLAGSSWNALSFASAESDPDNIVAAISDHRELIIFGRDTTEFFYNAGTTPFAFARNTSGYLEKGCAARFSIAKGDNSIFWLGRSQQGDGLVLKLEGYNPQVISTVSVNNRISAFLKNARIDDAIGFVFQEGGHEFYQLTFPTANETLVYDATSSAQLGVPIWHDRASYGVGRHIANACANFNGKIVVGDYASGKLYYQSQDYLDDNGTVIQRTLISEHFHASGNWVFGDELNILAETGVGLITGDYTDPQCTIEISRDGGHTYESYGPRSIGAIGDYKHEIQERRLGRARCFTLRLTISDPVRAYVLGARVRSRIGKT